MFRMSTNAADFSGSHNVDRAPVHMIVCNMRNTDILRGGVRESEANIDDMHIISRMEILCQSTLFEIMPHTAEIYKF